MSTILAAYNRKPLTLTTVTPWQTPADLAGQSDVTEFCRAEGSSCDDLYVVRRTVAADGSITLVARDDEGDEESHPGTNGVPEAFLRPVRLAWRSGYGPDLPAASSYVRVATDGDPSPEWALTDATSAADGWRAYCLDAEWHDADATLSVVLYDREGDEIDRYEGRVIDGKPVL